MYNICPKCKNVTASSNHYEVQHCRYCGYVDKKGEEKMSELLPCPFCGGKVKTKRWIGDEKEFYRYGVRCDNCTGSTNIIFLSCENEDQAATAWNHRPLATMKTDNESEAAKLIECKECGKKFSPSKDKVYTVIDEPRRINMFYFQALRMIDVIDCPKCGCQQLLSIRMPRQTMRLRED